MVPEVDPATVRAADAEADGIAERVVHHPQELVGNARRLVALIGVAPLLQGEMRFLSKSADVVDAGVRTLALGRGAPEPKHSAHEAAVALDEKAPVVLR